MLTATQTGKTLVDELARLGITEVVVSPGSRNAPLALAVAARPGDFRLHVRIDERTAAFLALGLSRGCGNPAAVLCSSGTATANYHPAVVEADAAGVPLIVLTADRPAELRGTGANQTIDQVALYGTASRYFADVRGTTDAAVRAEVRAALSAATAAWPGPVHLNVPLPEPLLDLDAPPAPPTSPSVESRSDNPDQNSTHRDIGVPPDAAALFRGHRVMVVAGEGADTGQNAEEILAAIGRLGVPLLAEPTSGLRQAPNAIRAGHWLAAAPTFLDEHQPDVVILLGRPVLSRAVTAMIEAAEVIVMCDPLQRGWDPGQNVTHVVDRPLGGWTTGLPAQQDGFLDAWRGGDGAACAVLDTILDQSVVSELGAARTVASAVPAGGQLVVASSLAIRHLNEVMHPRSDIRVLGNRGASGIDGFTSTAVGAALAHGGPTVALAGDLSIIHDLTGLVIGAEEPVPPLPVVILNNDGGGIFHLLPYGTHVAPETFRRLFATPHGIPLEGVAMTLGHGYTMVDTLAEMDQVLEDAWATPGITLIELTTHTPTETARYHQIRDAVDAAVSTPSDGTVS